MPHRESRYYETDHAELARNLVRRLVAARRPEGAWEHSPQFFFDSYSLERLAKRPFPNHGTLLRALKDIPADSPSDPLELFESSLEKTIAQHNRDLGEKSRQWTVWVPFDCKLSSGDIKHVRQRLLGNSVIIASHHFAHQLFNTHLARAPEHEVRRYAKGRIGLFVILRCTAATPDAAWRATEPTLELLRGIVEAYSQFGQWRWSGSPQPRRRMHPLSFALAVPRNESSSIVTLYYPSTSRSVAETFQPEISSAIMSKIPRDLPMLRKGAADSTSASFLAGLFRLYCQAWDQPFDYSQFLALWQLAEAITLVRPGQTKDRALAVRLAWFQTLRSNGPIGTVETIQKMERVRNRLVHAGVTNIIDEDDVNVLKHYCETAIGHLIPLAEQLKTTSDLKVLYSIVDRGEGTAEDEHRVLTELKQFRSRINPTGDASAQ